MRRDVQCDPLLAAVHISHKADKYTRSYANHTFRAKRTNMHNPMPITHFVQSGQVYFVLKGAILLDCQRFDPCAGVFYRRQQYQYDGNSGFAENIGSVISGGVGRNGHVIVGGAAAKEGHA